MGKKEAILSFLGEEEIFYQLAEESAELGHAALKLRRAVGGKNVTPVSEGAAMENLLEEIADVWLCLSMLRLDAGEARVSFEKTDKEEILSQLAESAAELGRNSLRFLRVAGGKVGAFNSKAVVLENLQENIAGVQLCLSLLGLDTDAAAACVKQTIEAKLSRWYSRLTAVQLLGST